MDANSYLGELAAFTSGSALLQRLVGKRPDPWQVEALLCDDTFQLILASRGIGKSTTIGLKAALFAETHRETTQIIICPSMRQSYELYRTVKKARDVFEGAHVVKRETQDTMELSNGSRVICVPGVEDTIRGYRAHRVYIDEGCRVDDATYIAALPMLVSDGQLIAASTPAGRQGWFYEAWEQGRGHQIMARSVDQPRMAKIVARDRELMSASAFRTEHLLTFAGSGEAFFDYDDVQRALIPGREVVLYA